jgi:glycosyltransferase involved in cell wall biosynthesis
MTANSEPIFSIIIPSWNNLEFLKLCIQSIFKTSKYQHQIIVHINEGSDGTIEWIKSQKIEYNYSQQNVGICWAMNQCRKLVKTDYILFLNDDMYVCPNWDETLLQEINKIGHHQFYLSSTLIEPRKTRNNCVLAPFDFGSNPNDFNETKLLQEFQSIHMTDWNGASWPPSLVHKEMFDLVGGYSTEFSPGMYSDPDFSMKLFKAGVRIFKGIGESKVYHFMSKTTCKVKPNNGRKQFLIKWGITANDYYHKVLKMGLPYRELEKDLDYKTNWINKIKILFEIIKSPGNS